MIYEKIDLYEYFNLKRGNGTEGRLVACAYDGIKELKPKLRPAMLVIPGGGYSHRSAREGEVVALRFMSSGYSAFVLEYSVNTVYPAPLLEACMAMIYIREHAQKYGVDAAHVGAVGFSAGGHLCAMLANIYGEKEITDVLGERAKLARPDAAVLSYPVITMGMRTHGGTRDVITGGNEELKKRLSLENRVTKDSAPAFIWHTYEDDCVPVENSLLLAGAYKQAGVPFALHIFEHGWHGLSLCSAETHNQTDADINLQNVGRWYLLALEWLASRGFCVHVTNY